MMAEALHGTGQDTSIAVPNNAYTIRWEPCLEDQQPNTTGLPSFDHAVYLYNAAKFHLGQHYRFLEDESFMTDMAELYFGDTRRKASECRLWFAQFLIVLAFGTAFTSLSRNPAEPSGKRYFVRGMALLPNDVTVWKESLSGIETVALASLYLYSVDNREAAVVKVWKSPSGLTLAASPNYCCANWPESLDRPSCPYGADGGSTHRASGVRDWP